jgi:hypothetical protein
MNWASVLAGKSAPVVTMNGLDAMIETGLKSLIGS